MIRCLIKTNNDRKPDQTIMGTTLILHIPEKTEFKIIIINNIYHYIKS